MYIYVCIYIYMYISNDTSNVRPGYQQNDFMIIS